MDSPNYFQAATSADKLSGKYYTPPELIRLMLEEVEMKPGDLVLDPSSGGGEFLAQSVHYLARRGGRGGAAGASAAAAAIAGFDISEEAVAASRQRVHAVLRQEFGCSVPETALKIRCADALELRNRADLTAALGLGPSARVLVVGNPPYVEAKRLPAQLKERLRDRFPDAASGAPDLYLYFLHVCLGWLERDDRLALVLPNKTLVNANGASLRERIIANGELRGIMFATRAGLFPGAAVYPIVLYAGAGSTTGSTAIRLTSLHRRDGALYASELSELDPTNYVATRSRAFFPTPGSAVLRDALVQLLRGGAGRLDEVLDIRWSVSFHRRGLRERFVLSSQPPGPHGQRYLGGSAFAGNGEVRRYRIDWRGGWIDYDAGALRREGNGLPPLELFRRAKIVICQNGRTLRAAYDPDGFVLKDTFLCGDLRASTHPLSAHPQALVGLLCSQAVHFFYSHVFHGGHVNDGYLHFLRSFLIDVPLGAWTIDCAAEVAALVDERQRAVGRRECDRTEAAIESIVSHSLGLTSRQSAAIREWAGADRNWIARHRVRTPADGG